jgi:hypothetical protein
MQEDHEVVLEVLPDAGRLLNDLDAPLAEVVRGADPRKQEQLRGIDGAAAQDDFPRGAGHVRLPAGRVGDPRGTFPLEEDAFGEGARPHRQVPAPQGGPQERVGTTPAAPALQGHLKEAGPVLFAAVEVGVLGGADLRRRPDEGPRQGVGVAQVRDVQGPAHAVEGVRAALVVLGVLELGEDIGVAPPRVAQAGPLVEVLAVPAAVDVGVDAGAPA